MVRIAPGKRPRNWGRAAFLVGLLATVFLTGTTPKTASAEMGPRQAYLLFGGWLCANWFCYISYCCTELIID
jgi:uncharacterized membrane protein YdcZ (DUF606 family)